MNKIINILNLILRTLRRFISLSFIFVIMLLLVRIFELVITSNFNNYPVGSSIPLLKGIIYDIIFYLQISALLLVPYLILGLIKQNLARTFYIVVAVIVVFSDILLMKYFSVSEKPLGAELFEYSFQKIWDLIWNSGEATVAAIIVTILFLIYMIRIFTKHIYYRIKPWTIVLLTVLMFSSLLPIKQLNPEQLKFKDEFSCFVATNKIDYFAKSVINYYQKRNVE